MTTAAPGNPVMLPEAPILTVGLSAAVWISAEGEVAHLDPKAAAQRARNEAPLLCHAPATARRLGLGPFPAYDLLDTVLKAYLEEKKTLPEIIEMGYSSELVKNILNMIESNEYKRQQAAPGIKVSWKAFGIGRRYPIAKAALF